MTAPLKVAIVGTGLIGRGWAVAFARAGWLVSLWDQDPAAAEAARDHVGRALADLAAAGLDCAAGAAANVSVAATLKDAVDGVSWVQESLPENRDVKEAIFRAIDAVTAPGVPVASSTSTMPGSSFLADVPGRDRCIVAHPANPPHLMPVVEIVPSPWHTPEFVAATRAILAGIGQVPVVVKKEVPGFVMNRLQTAVVNEAMALVGSGAISPEDLDAVMKHSLGLRWAFMGPFETMDLNAPNGFLDYATRYGVHYQEMGRDLSVAEPWSREAMEEIEQSRRAATPATEVGARMRWRDRALMRLLALKNEMERDGSPATL